MNAMSAIPDVNPAFVPRTEAELRACLRSWEWRIFSGQLYKIITKSLDSIGDEVTQVVPFVPNQAQTDFLSDLHTRNVILKARQLGFTTASAIVYLDHAAFNANQRCAIIAHTREDAEAIFRDKVKFAYENLPETLRARMPLKRDSATEILFAHNNSSVRVATSARSGTIHRLHISEMGKIGAKHPEKAVEIVTGSLPAVPDDGIAIIESTAEGTAGEFYKIATKAQHLKEAGKKLTPAEFRFHFFPWWSNPEYTMPSAGVVISPEEHAYFDNVEAEMGCFLTLGQRAWYISKRDTAFSGDVEKMWREYPSTPGECWQKSTEGTYYAPQLARARAEGRMVDEIPHVSNVLMHTFWDIGAGDGTAIWFMQHVGTQERFLRYIEDYGRSYEFFVLQMRDMQHKHGYLYGTHFLPHDAGHERQMGKTLAKPVDMLRDLAPDWTFIIVPRVEITQHGIEMTRQAFSRAWFSMSGCKAGVEHLSRYQKTWNQRHQFWSDTPLHNEHSEAADSFRQWAQGYDPRIATPGASRMTRSPRQRRGVMI